MQTWKLRYESFSFRNNQPVEQNRWICLLAETIEVATAQFPKIVIRFIGWFPVSSLTVKIPKWWICYDTIWRSDCILGFIASVNQVYVWYGYILFLLPAKRKCIMQIQILLYWFCWWEKDWRHKLNLHNTCPSQFRPSHKCAGRSDNLAQQTNIWNIKFRVDNSFVNDSCS